MTHGFYSKLARIEIDMFVLLGVQQSYRVISKRTWAPTFKSSTKACRTSSFDCKRKYAMIPSVHDGSFLLIVRARLLERIHHDVEKQLRDSLLTA